MYRLVASFPAHDGPIKTICTNSRGEIVTGGQDAILNRWKVEDDGEGSVISTAAAPLHHSYWVTAVGSLAPNCHPLFPEGLTICGTRDNLIRLYDLEGNLVKCLSGHEKPPVSFSWTTNFDLVSGSWDGTARVWDLVSGENVMTFGGHENAVNVLCLTQNETSEPSLLATVSSGESVNRKPANFKLRIWSLISGQQVITPIEDHAGSIRSIFRIPGTGFATTSNDGSVLVRSSLDLKSATGGEVSVFLHPPQCGGDGFPPFILGGTAVDLSLITSNPLERTGFVSCGEDGSVIIWKGTEMEQLLPHPTSVWSVCTISSPGYTPKGTALSGWYGSDIATAGHDGVLRVFSCDPARVNKPLSLALQEDLDRDITLAIASQNKGPSADEIAKAPKWENRGSISGDSEAQVRIFNKDGIAFAAQWSSDSGAWVGIGEVTGRASGDGGEVHGVTYDHIMPVEIETARGVVTLQLGYNDLENPFISAQRFIDQNDLDQNYLGQIADFILARSGKSSAPTFDMSSPVQSYSSSNAADVMDSSSQVTSSKRPRHSFTMLPLQIFFSYEDIPTGLETKFMTKIRDFHTAFLSSSDGIGSLSESDINVLQNSLRILADTSHYHSSRLPDSILSAINTMLCSWTDTKTLFPSFDLLRLISAHPLGSQQLASSPLLTSIITKAVSVILQDFFSDNVEFSAALKPASSPQALTALRFLTTTFRHSHLRQSILALFFGPQCDEIFVKFSNYIGNVNSLSSSSVFKSTHRHALSSWCSNVALVASMGEGIFMSSDIVCTVLSVYYPTIIFFLDQEVDNADVVVRTLMTVGTLSMNNSIQDILKTMDVGIENIVRNLSHKWKNKSTDYFEQCLREAAIAVKSKDDV